VKNSWFHLLDRLRTYGTSSSAASTTELFLGFLYLKIHKPESWTQLTADRHPGTINRSLRDIFPDGILPFGNLRFGDILEARLHVLDIVDQFQTPQADNLREIAQVVHDFIGLCVTAQGKKGGRNTPDSLVRLIMALVEPKSGDRIYDPFAQYGELLIAAASGAYHTGQPISALTGEVPSQHELRVVWLSGALLGSDVSRHLDVTQWFALTNGARDERRHDLIVTNPPFNLHSYQTDYDANDRRWRYGEPPPNNANFAWLQHVLSTLTPNGRAAVLMANSSTFSQHGAERAIRATMLKAGVVESVLALPPNLFASTGIPVTLWLLRNSPAPQRDVLFIDATEFGEMRSRSQRTLTDEEIEHIVNEYRTWRDRKADEPYQPVAGLSRNVTFAEICQRDYVLNPRVYVTSPVELPDMPHAAAAISALRAELTELHTRADVRNSVDSVLPQIDLNPSPVRWERADLGSVCEILAGPGQVARTEFQDSLVPVVLPRNIRHGRIDDRLLEVATEEQSVRYRLAAGDIVCPRTGELGRSGVISAGQEGWLLGPGCIRLRLQPTAHVDPGYLVHYLNTPEARSWLDRNATGSAIKTLSTRTLAELPLPLPPMAQQRAIAAALNQLNDLICVHERISATTTALRDALSPLLINGVA
jgi:type I restriction enzyme M protein